MSTPEPLFTPRKEFIRIPLPTPDSFALLALSSSNFIRLYSFPASVVDALRHLFEQLSIILSLREDLSQSLYEFALDGKPWANAKAVFTEKLLLDILAIIYQCGYRYLSTIDYGRENDDRLAMVFSKPGTPPFINPQNTNSLAPSMPAINSTSLEKKVQRVPFALSFASATLMRVISPPLHLTPAILQAVRASWPRGVVSEKKVGDNSFEFRLKGYKWFQQDTFATDSLRHILALLTSLDSYSFSLLTSLSLAHRSRVKDLWIFTGPAPEDSLPATTPELKAAVPNMRRLPLQGFSIEANHPIDVPYQHKQFITEPTVHLPSPQHSRATTDGPQRLQYSVSKSPQPHLLRKPAPRAQVPVSVFQDSDIPDEHHQVLRAHMPSTISSGVENMTGVGAVGLKQDILSLPLKVGGSAAHEHSDLQLGPDRMATLPTFPKQPPQSNAKNKNPIPSANDFSLPPLVMNVFTDSAFSSNTTTPTGSYKKDAKLEQGTPRLNPSHSSSGPMFPGGWQSTPVDEKLEEKTQNLASTSEKKSTPSTPINENDYRIEAPVMVTPDLSLTDSEAALIRIIASTSHAPSILQSDKPRMEESQPSLGSGSRGWVLVNVEGNAAGSMLGSESACPIDAATSQSHELKRTNSPLTTGFSTPSTSKSLALEQPSPAAKAIVIIDAMDSKRKKRSTMQPKESRGGELGLKRFFSLNKKNLASEERLRETPEASRREGKRRIVD